MLSIRKKEATVNYGTPFILASGQGALKHKACDLEIALPEGVFEAKLYPGSLGLTLKHLSPQPIGEHFSVVWNGDCASPVFKFDGAPSVAKVRVEYWGH